MTDYDLQLAMQALVYVRMIVMIVELLLGITEEHGLSWCMIQPMFLFDCWVGYRAAMVCRPKSRPGDLLTYICKLM